MQGRLWVWTCADTKNDSKDCRVGSGLMLEFLLQQHMLLCTCVHDQRLDVHVGAAQRTCQRPADACRGACEARGHRSGTDLDLADRLVVNGQRIPQDCLGILDGVAGH